MQGLEAVELPERRSTPCPLNHAFLCPGCLEVFAYELQMETRWINGTGQPGPFSRMRIDRTTLKRSAPYEKGQNSDPTS
jgi:hypothetical protein